MNRRILLSALLLMTTTIAAAAQQVYLAKDDGVTLPVAVERVVARYTPEAWDQRIEGTVHVDCDVLADGSIGPIAVTTSLDKKFGLDEQAIKAMQQWKFRPGLKDGKPTTVRIPVAFQFTLARAAR